MQRKLRSFHRYFALLAAVLAAVLSVTGILLNHTSELKLDEIPIRNSAILDWYGVEPASISGFQTEIGWVLGDGHHVYLNQKTVASCPVLVGAIWLETYLIIACRESLLLAANDGSLVETMDSSSGLPTPITGVGNNSGLPILVTAEKTYSFDPEEMKVAPTDTSYLPISSTEKVPNELTKAIGERSAPQEMHLERLLLDIHSGRILGTFGVMLVDLAAILLLLMAFSGLWIWLHRQR
jgi:hypothetical protein